MPRFLVPLVVCVLIAASLASARAQAAGTLSGHVKEIGSGQPVAGVDVVLPGFKLKATTDADGRYTIANVPAGPMLLVGRKIGWEEHSAAVRIDANATKEYNFSLLANPAALDTMKVVAISPENRLALDLFAEHRKLGFGRFFDSTALRKREIAKVADMVREISGVTLVTPPLCRPLGGRTYNCSPSAQKKVAVSGSGCVMRVLLDRMVLSDGGQISNDEGSSDFKHDWVSAYDLSSMLVSNLVAMEVFPRGSNVPMDYQGPGAECGVVQLWTNRR